MIFAQEEVIDTIAVGDTPRGVAYNPDNGYMYVTYFSSDNVSESTYRHSIAFIFKPNLYDLYIIKPVSFSENLFLKSPLKEPSILNRSFIFLKLKIFR
jgi:hypothetical protein